MEQTPQGCSGSTLGAHERAASAPPRPCAPSGTKVGQRVSPRGARNRVVAELHRRSILFLSAQRACPSRSRHARPRSPSTAWRRAAAPWAWPRALQRVRVRFVVRQPPALRVRPRARQDALLTRARCHRVGRTCAACWRVRGAQAEAPEVRERPPSGASRTRAPERPPLLAQLSAAAGRPGARPARAGATRERTRSRGWSFFASRP